MEDMLPILESVVDVFCMIVAFGMVSYHTKVFVSGVVEVMEDKESAEELAKEMAELKLEKVHLEEELFLANQMIEWGTHLVIFLFFAWGITMVWYSLKGVKDSDEDIVKKF